MARPFSFHQSSPCSSLPSVSSAEAGAAHGVPDRLGGVRHVRRQRMVPVRSLERNAGRALVDRGVVFLEQAGAARELGRDRREVARLAARLDRGLAQREALLLPELLDELRAADADQLQAFEVGRLGQQHVGVMVGLVARVGERDHEREARHLLPDRLRVPERDRGIRPVDEPDVGQRDPRQALRRLVQEHPREMRGAERLAPRPVRGERHHRPVGVADVRIRRPVLLVRRVERVVHEPVGARAARCPRAPGPGD